LTEVNRGSTPGELSGHSIDIGQFSAMTNPLAFKFMPRTDRELIGALPLFRDVTQATLAELLRVGLLQQFQPHATLFNEGDWPDCLVAVAKGSIELYSNHAGRETTTDIVNPKMTCGLAAIVREDVHLSSARTLTPSQVLTVPADTVRHLLRSDVSFARAVEKELAGTCVHLAKVLKNQKLRSGAERLANWILDTDRRQGNRGRIHLPYDKRTLAAYLGMTPESLSRKFASLVDHGVTGCGREVTITDREALRKWAKPDPLIDG
jgi:CRP/FNR family transcriptional activator FtrB